MVLLAIMAPSVSEHKGVVCRNVCHHYRVQVGSGWYATTTHRIQGGSPCLLIGCTDMCHNYSQGADRFAKTTHKVHGGAPQLITGFEEVCYNYQEGSTRPWLLMANLVLHPSQLCHTCCHTLVIDGAPATPWPTMSLLPPHPGY